MLEWARDFPLKIVVTRHRGTSETHDSERTDVGRAMEFLRPYIGRIWSLSFDVGHSSSIPALWRESGRARRLRVLTLMSRSDAGRISQQVAFSRHFLKNPLMAHPRLAVVSGRTAPPMYLSHLRIVDCDNFNGGDVISLVQSRETQATFVSLMDVADDDSFTALAEVRVQGRGPPISVRRGTWLGEHVETFCLDTVARDGMRYVHWEIDGVVRK